MKSLLILFHEQLKNGIFEVHDNSRQSNTLTAILVHPPNMHQLTFD